MKKNLMLRIGALALAGCCITMTMLSGTFAKYTSAVTGTGTATVAKWDVALEATVGEAKKTADFSFTLTDTMTSGKDKVTAGKIAPGATGEIPVSVNCGTTEVETKITIGVDTTNLSGVPVGFYSDKECTDANKITSDKPFTATIKLNDATKTLTPTIYWKWDASDVGQGVEDTAAGVAAATGSFKISMTAEQVIDTTTVAP